MAGTTAEAWIGQPIELWVQLGNGQHVSGTLEGVLTRAGAVLTKARPTQSPHASREVG
jgi:hypothetical protein